MTYTIREPDDLIKWLIKHDIVATYYDPKKREQMADITQFGRDVNEVLMYMIKSKKDDKRQ